MSFYEIRDHFDCEEYTHDQEKPLPSPEVWRSFQDEYREVVDPDRVFDDPRRGIRCARRGVPRRTAPGILRTGEVELCLHREISRR